VLIVAIKESVIQWENHKTWSKKLWVGLCYDLLTNSGKTIEYFEDSRQNDRVVSKLMVIALQWGSK
jgi:hypothetical protein